MIPCVLDASVALAWVFEDEDSPYAEFVIGALARQRAVVPIIWPFEVLNALVAAVRRGRIEEARATPFLSVLDRLPLEIDGEVARGTMGQRLFGLSVRYGLSAYDASYLELAIRRGLPLATLDERLARAASRAGIEILQP